MFGAAVRVVPSCAPVVNSLHTRSSLPSPPAPVQVRAMFEAAVHVVQGGGRVQLDVMVPLVGTAAELKNQEQLVRRIANEVSSRRGRRGGC